MLQNLAQTINTITNQQLDQQISALTEFESSLRDFFCISSGMTTFEEILSILLSLHGNHQDRVEKMIKRRVFKLVKQQSHRKTTAFSRIIFKNMATLEM